MDAENLFNSRYFLERLLGRGNFSEVWLAKDTKTGIYVALKIYAPATGLDDAGLDVLAREFSLVVNANHKNLLKPLYYDSCDRKPFLVLPYCEKGSIMKDMGKMSEKDAWRLLRDVAAGLSWLHNMTPPVIHQDIKPDNVMVGENGDFMITDFGVSTHVKSTLRKSMSAAFSSAGTIAYMAPERFSKNNTPIMANDIYSLGATTFEMLTGDTPFGDDGGLIQMKGAEVPELKGEFSHSLKSVIERCLRTNPWERPTAEQLERIADDGLNGRKISFPDEKSSINKNKLLVIAGLTVAAIIIALVAIFTGSGNTNAMVGSSAGDLRARTDSLQSLIERDILLGDSLAAVGAMHDEGYETSLLEAYNLYGKALALEMEIESPDSHTDLLHEKMKTLGQQLYDAYVSFNEKASIFADEPEIAAEFTVRAKSIGDAINIDEYSKDNYE